MTVTEEAVDRVGGRYSVEVHRKALRRMSSGESVAAIAADTGISRSTLSRWKSTTNGRRTRARLAAAPVQPPAGRGAKLADVTGVGITDRWGVAATDLGASVLAPNGTLVSVFGDTFSGVHVGEGLWRAPVVLIGSGDARHPIRYEHAGGSDPTFAQQLWFYIHDDPSTGWSHGGISTVLPSDLLRVDDTLYLHAIVNRGFPNVIWTEIWSSTDNGITWHHMGEKAKFAADLHHGQAQCWSWDYEPDDGWVYVVSTGFQRDKGIVLRRVRADGIGDNTRYVGWGWDGQRWGWGNEPTPITPADEHWGGTDSAPPGARKVGTRWLPGVAVRAWQRVIASPTANLHQTPIQTPVVGTTWEREDHADGAVAQLYGGYVLPGAQLDVIGGTGLVVSQWNTTTGYPYRVMQFQATLADTTAVVHNPADPRNLRELFPVWT